MQKYDERRTSEKNLCICFSFKGNKLVNKLLKIACSTNCY